jgi:hypothetical protein
VSRGDECRQELRLKGIIRVLPSIVDENEQIDIDPLQHAAERTSYPLLAPYCKQRPSSHYQATSVRIQDCGSARHQLLPFILAVGRSFSVARSSIITQ